MLEFFNAYLRTYCWIFVFERDVIERTWQSGCYMPLPAGMPKLVLVMLTLT